MKAETLQERLARLVPGAKVHHDASAPLLERHVVSGWRTGKSGKWELTVLATGASEREAIDRAIFLWGRPR